jgi:formate/nitrite transporter FocA (FNT family)
MKQRRSQKRQPSELHPQQELELSDREEKEIEQRMRPNAVIIHEAVRIEGERELRRPTSALAWSGLAAGLSMGFSLIAQGLLKANLPHAPWSQLISKLGYSIGFLIVVMGRQQLFTENTLTVILPLLARRKAAVLMQVLRLWSVVLLSNLIGTFLFAWIVKSTNIFSVEVQDAFTEIGLKALSGGFWTTLWQGVFAGWLIALMVWLLPTVDAARLWLIIIITFIVGLGELAHVIAGSVEVFYAIVTGSAPFGAYFGSFMIPALAGNIIGGVSLVAVLNYAQVAPEKH